MRDLLIEMIDKYMTIHKPTRLGKIKTPLPHKARTLKELEESGFIAEAVDAHSGETVYFPRMLAFESVNEPRRRKAAYARVGKSLFELRDKTRQGDPQVADGVVVDDLAAVLLLDFPTYTKEIRDGYYLTTYSRYAGGYGSVVLRDTDVKAGKYPNAQVGRVAIATEAIDTFEDVGAAWDQELRNRGLGEYIEKRKTTGPEQVQAQAQVLKQKAVLPPQFSFVQDQKLRSFIERDYEDLKRARISGSLRLRFVLAGGLIEGLLLDALISRPATMQTAAAKKEGKTPEYWSLGGLLDAATELQLLRTSVEKLGSPVREFRNMVHPGVEWRSGTPIEIEEVEIVERVLDLVIRDLSRQQAQRAIGTPQP